jgi:4-diphosphocytidyl-2-C-methyl-D-erythritol kinase
VTGLTLAACAKLNLFLHVVGRREDGYHLLQTVFQLVDLADEVTLLDAPEGVLELTADSDAPGGEDDLTLRAARALRDAVGGRRGVRIRLRKTIPAGGGLGGGSSDAATVLLGLRRLWGLDVGLDALADLGVALGADVPVFVRGRTAWAEGVGDRTTPLATAPACYVVLVPDAHVETARVFSDPRLTRDTPISTMPAFFEPGGRNDCAPVTRALHPEVDRALVWLGDFGDARMSGTGASIFLRCDEIGEARRIAARVPAPWQGLVTRSLEVSPTHVALGLD